MNTMSNEFEYVEGQFRPTFPDLFAEFERRNKAAESAEGWEFDIRYGTHPRETFDLRLAPAGGHAIVIYLHAGYWQSRDKGQFRFVTPALNDAGFDVALLNYPLCPDVSIGGIADSVRNAADAVLRAIPGGRSRKPVAIVGHSAGAHLAVEIALSQRAAAGGARVDAIVSISGVFDLVPLIDTSLNRNLRLDMASATACSPLGRVVDGLPPAAFVVGADETAAFRHQSEKMFAAWSGHGNASSWHPVHGADHFTVLKGFYGADGLLVQLLKKSLRKKLSLG